MSTELAAAAKAMVAPGKGILAADESTGTANKRFAPLNIPLTEEMRQKYRDMLFTTPDFGKFFSGVILYDETIRQNGNNGETFVKILDDAGSLPGIKLDMGQVSLPLANPIEKVTEGLDGLGKRVDEYVKMGAKFAKWRATIAIDKANGLPSDAAIVAAADGLARYAAICQAGGLVPIVEPEVLMDGGAKQTIEESFAVHERTLRFIFDALADQNVKFEEMILKPSMVIPGEAAAKASPDDVAQHTLTALLRWVPAAVAGIAFLSGGQADVEATDHLNRINVLAKKANAPWPITFSYGRALQHASITVWKGQDANVVEAQKALHHRAQMNSLAALGQWTPDSEKASALAMSH